MCRVRRAQAVGERSRAALQFRVEIAEPGPPRDVADDRPKTTITIATMVVYQRSRRPRREVVTLTSGLDEISEAAPGLNQRPAEFSTQ